MNELNPPGNNAKAGKQNRRKFDSANNVDPPPVADWQIGQKIIGEFSVPYQHRVWFCDGPDRMNASVLTDCFWPGPASYNHEESAKVQIWIDAAVDSTNPGFVDDFCSRIQSLPKLTLSRPVQRIDGGEGCKNDSAVVDRILNAIHQDHLDRRSYLVVIGGGAVLDVVGYAAAIAHRGIRLVRLPTTTLAQADSGVGVKNAVNWFGKKNWKGTFAVPWGVINVYSLLKTLPQRAFVEGFAEALKVSLLKSPTEFKFLVGHAGRIANRDATVCQSAIHASANLHLRHICDGGDPFEIREARPLDFGHWSAHKLESISNYRISHGEAVATGLAIDVIYSVKKLGLAADVAGQTIATLARLGLPVWDELLNTASEQVLFGLEEFREHLGGRLTVTMVTSIGHSVDVHEIDQPTVEAIFELLANINLRLNQGRADDSGRESEVAQWVTSMIKSM